MRQFPKKPTTLQEIKEIFPELTTIIDSFPAMTDDQTKALITFFGEAVGQIGNYRQRAANVPLDTLGILSAISAYVETNIDIGSIPDTPKDRQTHLKDLATAGRNAEGERISKTGIISIMASIITNDKYGIYNNPELTRHFCTLVNAFANYTEKELFGYTISKSAREQFLEAESFAKQILNVKVMPTTLIKTTLTDVQRNSICQKYGIAIGDIIQEIEQNSDINPELKSKLRKNLEEKIHNIAKVVGGGPAMVEYMLNIAKFGNLQPAIDELIKQSKHLTTLNIDKENISRSNRIFKEFGAVMKGHDPQNLAWVFQTVIPKMKVKNVEVLMKEPNKTFILNAIKTSEQFSSITKDYTSKNTHTTTNIPAQKVEITTKVIAKVEAPKPATPPTPHKLETREVTHRIKAPEAEKIDFFKKKKHHHSHKKHSLVKSETEHSKKEYKGKGLTERTKERDKVRHTIAKEGLSSRSDRSDSGSSRSR